MAAENARKLPTAIERMFDRCPEEFCGIDDQLKKQLSFHRANFDPTSQNNIALLLCGQTRTFVLDKINTAINDYIQQLKQHGFNVVCFFFVNASKPNWKGSEWHYTSLVDRFGCVDSIQEAHTLTDEYFDTLDTNQEQILEIINNKIHTECCVKFYDESFVDKIFEQYEYIHGGKVSIKIQWESTKQCLGMVKAYERKKNIKFGKIIRTRPDIHLYTRTRPKYPPPQYRNPKKRRQFFSYLKSDGIFYTGSDQFMVFPRYALDFVQSVGFPDFKKDWDMIAMQCHMNDWEITHFWILLKLHFAGFTNIKYLSESADYKTFNDTLCMGMLNMKKK